MKKITAKHSSVTLFIVVVPFAFDISRMVFGVLIFLFKTLG